MGWEGRGKEKFLRGTTKYSMTRPAQKTAALSVPKKGERLHSSPRPPPSPSPPFPAKASGWSGPLGAVDTTGGQRPLELTESKQFRVEKRALSRVHREVGGRKEGGEDWLREK